MDGLTILTNFKNFESHYIRKNFYFIRYIYVTFNVITSYFNFHSHLNNISCDSSCHKFKLILYLFIDKLRDKYIIYKFFWYFSNKVCMCI